MFYLGDQIVIIESSIGKNIGPRKGSLGFFSEKLADYSKIAPKQYGVQFNGLFDFTAMTVVFFRYGYQNKLRVEKKNVLLITPYITEKTGIKELENIVSFLASKKNTEAKEKLCKIIGVEKIPVVLALPSNNKINLAECDPLIFKAWFLAIIGSTEFTTFEATTTCPIPIPYIEKYDWKEGIEAVSDMRKLGSYEVDKLIIEAGFRKETIHTIRYVLASKIRLWDVVSDDQDMRNVISRDVTTRNGAPINKVIFKRQIFEKLRKYIEDRPYTSTIRRRMENLAAFRAECEGLSDRIVNN